MTIFFFQRRLMPTARKGIVAMVCQILAPLRQGAVRYSQFTGDLGLRLPAGFDKAHRFDLEFLGGRFLLFFSWHLLSFVELSLSSLLPPQRWAIVKLIHVSDKLRLAQTSDYRNDYRPAQD